jgi:hypothetical protein
MPSKMGLAWPGREYQTIPAHTWIDDESDVYSCNVQMRLFDG